MSPLIRLLRNKNFLYLWFGQITSQIAVNMLGFILMIRVYQQTSSNIAVSGMIFAIGVPAIFFGILAGGLVDQMDKRKILIACNILRALLLLVFFWANSTIIMMYILAFIFSLITQFFIPAEAPSIPAMVSSEELLPANSLFTFSLYASTIIGFVLSGPALRVFGQFNIFIFLAFVMFVASIFAYLLPRDKTKHKSVDLSMSKISRDIKEGFAFIRKNKRIEQSLLLVTFSQALIAVLASLAPGFSDKTLKIVLEDASYLVMGPAAIGLILGALVVGTWGKYFLKRILILVGILGTGSTLILLSLLVRVSHINYFTLLIGNIPLGGLEVAMIIILFLGFTNALISVPATTVLQEDTTGNLRGRIYGVLTSLTGGAAILPVIFSGFLADKFGIGKTLFMVGIFVICFGIYRLLKLRTTSFSIEST